MHSMVRSSIASVSRTSLQCYCPRISNQRFPNRCRRFHQTPQKTASAGGSNKPDSAATDTAAHDSSIPLVPDNAVQGRDGCTALPECPVKDLSHYGSAARRSKRNRTDDEVTQSVQLPGWFIESNVCLAEDASPSSIEFTRTYEHKALEALAAAQSARRSASKSLSKDAYGDGKKPAKAENVSPRTFDAPYYVEHSQFEELVSTASGLMNIPERMAVDDVALKKHNLVVHYAGEGGDYLVDQLLQSLAERLRTDVIVLDALDVSELACETHLCGLSEDADDVAVDRRLLGYDVYQREESQTAGSSSEGEHENETSEEADGQDQTGSHKQVTSTILLSPLNLSVTGAPRRRRSRRQGYPSGTIMPPLESLFSDKVKSEAQLPKAAQRRLGSLVEALLSAPVQKRTERSKAAGAADPKSKSTSSTASAGSVKVPLIIQIRDMKLLQQTTFGQKLLNIFYEHVMIRRRGRQQVMIVGTDTFSSRDQYSAVQIRNIQSEPPEHISRTLVITPVLPSAEQRLKLGSDRKRRIRTINTRHLWQLLGVNLPKLMKNISARQRWALYAEIPGGDIWAALNLVDVNARIWTFDQVHRLATLVVGQMVTNPEKKVQDNVLTACDILHKSDGTRDKWTEHSRLWREMNKAQNEHPWTARLARIQKTLNKYEKKLVPGVIEPDKIATTFSQVHLPLDTIEAVKSLTTLSLVRPDAFKYGVLASDKIPGLLLYGPPGTGKTLLAKAVAKESGATMLEASGAELNDMYVGEGEKNIKALFSIAMKLSPCVLFIDEADAILAARNSHHNRVSHRDMLNQFLKQWDGMSNGAGSAFIMVATNRPFDLDDAVLRRLPRRVLVDLPAENDRLEILKIHLRDEVLAVDVNLADLAAKTPFYSGSDLKNVCVGAALNCVRDEIERAKTHSGGSVDGDSGSEEGPSPPRAKRTLAASHFARALEEISASISENMDSLKSLKKFDDQYGDRRNKKNKSPSRWGFDAMTGTDKAKDTVRVRNL